MAKKLYDLAVKTGSYTNQSGETKGRYQNIGAVMQGDDGGKFIFMSSWFNPAGVDRREGSESILVSMFEPRPAGGQTDHGREKAYGYAPAPKPAQKLPVVDDNETPF